MLILRCFIETYKCIMSFYVIIHAYRIEHALFLYDINEMNNTDDWESYKNP